MTSTRSIRRKPATVDGRRAFGSAEFDERQRRGTRPSSGSAPAAIMTISLAVLAAVSFAAGVGAQETEHYGDRLSRMPVDLRTTAAISGAGAVSAELLGNELTITVRFSGLSSGVTAAHVHNAPVARRGGVAFPVEVGNGLGDAGEIVDTVTLDDDQIAELRGERYYVQIHTENNPGGELRGWLLRHDDRDD